jgi:hypothetical protein
MANSHPNPPGRKQKAESERRRTHRFPATAIPGLKTVNLGTGPEVELVNISRGGALVESLTRLTPSSNISLRLLAGESSFVIRGRVLRSQVAGFLGSMLKYRSAIQFTQEFVLLPEVESPVSDAEPRISPQSAGSSPAATPLASASAPLATEPTDPAEGDLTFTAHCASFDELETLLRANNW